MDSGTTAKLKALAPTLAGLPRFTRSLPATAAWTGVTLLFLGAASLFWRTVTLSTDVALVHKDVQTLEAGLAAMQKQSEDIGAIKLDLNVVKLNSANTMTEVAGMRRWREDIERTAEKDWRPAPKRRMK